MYENFHEISFHFFIKLFMKFNETFFHEKKFVKFHEIS
jgi:hypothetical protein